MATSKHKLSDLLRQEAQQDKGDKPSAPSKAKTTIPTPPSSVELSRMTKAQLLAHINRLYTQQNQNPTLPAAIPPEILSKNQALADQVKALEEKIAAQQTAIATAETTIKTLQADSSEKAQLEQELTAQKSLVEKLYAQVQNLEAQQVAAQQAQEQAQARNIEADRALVLARIASYQANLQFPSQPAPSIPEDEIGWFD